MHLASRILLLGFFVVAGLTAGCDNSDTVASKEPDEATQPATIPTLSLPSGSKPAPAKPAPEKPAKARSVPIGTGFDFYVLSLSWSPSYCEAEGEDANGQQCNTGRPYAFVVHGLWPQFEKGWPEDCRAEPSYVADDIVSGLRDIMPSAGLIGYQWRKHGSCSGLSQDDYFSVLRSASERVNIPEPYRKLNDYLTVTPKAVEDAFLSVNGGMSAKGTAVTCDSRYLREVRICMTKDLSFRACPAVDQRACTLKKTVMPPVRGG